MPTTVKTGWLKDKNGDKFAPKTLTSQVQTNDGILIEDKIQADLNALQDALNGKAASSDLTDHANNKSNPHGVTAAQVGAYSKTEIDNMELITVADIDAICGTTIIDTTSNSEVTF